MGRGRHWGNAYGLVIWIRFSIMSSNQACGCLFSNSRLLFGAGHGILIHKRNLLLSRKAPSIKGCSQQAEGSNTSLKVMLRFFIAWIAVRHTTMIRIAGPVINFNGVRTQNIGEDAVYIDFLGTTAGVQLHCGKELMSMLPKTIL